MENDFQQIKGLISPYNLSLHRKKDICFLLGTEKNKRRFLRAYLFQNNWELFMQNQKISKHFGKSFSHLRHDLKIDILKNGLYINDYSLALLSLSIAIQILRIFKGFYVT